MEPDANITIANGVIVNNTGVELSSSDAQSTAANRITLNSEGISLDNWTDVTDLDNYGNKKTSLKITDKIYYNDKEIATKDDLSNIVSSSTSGELSAFKEETNKKIDNKTDKQILTTAGSTIETGHANTENNVEVFTGSIDGEGSIFERISEHGTPFMNNNNPLNYAGICYGATSDSSLIIIGAANGSSVNAIQFLASESYPEMASTRMLGNVLIAGSLSVTDSRCGVSLSNADTHINTPTSEFILHNNKNENSKISLSVFDKDKSNKSTLDIVQDGLLFNNKNILTEDKLKHSKYDLQSTSVEFDGYKDIVNEKYVGINNYPVLKLNTNGDISVNTNSIEYEYTFEMITQDKTDINLTLLNCSLPKDFVFKPYTAYVCKIINGNICVLDEFDAFPYTWIYGTYLSASSGKSFTFKSDFTVSYYDGSSSKTGTYNISKIDSLYSIHLNIANIATDTITTTDINSFSYEEDTFTKTAL